jgi:CubicO group peptidase (beta-lactamase class C family)
MVQFTMLDGMSDAPMPQGSWLVVRGDAVVACGSAGLADAETGEPCSASTRFQLASVSKQFTAAAVLLLAERGAFDLADPLARWVAGPEAWRPITLHHLLAHTSGLGHWEEYPTLDLTAWLEPDDVLETFRSVPPLFAAGAGWRYSSPGYVLLAHVVERAAAVPYREFLDREVFAPLGMAGTFAGMPGGRDGGAGVARGHDGPRPVPSFELDSVGMGAGDVWSTTGDMRRWLAALRAGTFLSARSRELMLTERAATGRGGEAAGYGYGWFVGDLDGERAVFHFGDNAGFKAFDAWLPGSDRHVVILSNQHRVDASAVARLLRPGRL